MPKSHLTSSVSETQTLAQDLAASLSSGKTIALIGELGAGKTTFTQGFGTHFDISRMTSPTYTLIKEYNIEKHPSIKKIFHIDLYRLSSPEEILELGLPELWSDPQNILLIEWPEKIKDLLPPGHIKIKLIKGSENKRKITITK